MKGIVSRCFFRIALALLGTLSASAYAAERIPGEYLVKYRNASALAAFNLRSTPGVRLLEDLPSARLLKIHVDPAHEAEVTRNLAGGLDAQIEYIAPNLRVFANRVPLDRRIAAVRHLASHTANQWALTKIHAAEAWSRAGNRGSRSVKVAVIDTGADYRHQSLAPNMVKGWDFIRNNDDPMDHSHNNGGGHGTHCAGVIGATGLVEDGTIGISPKVSIMPLRFLDEDGKGETFNAIRAIDYAIAHGAQVISASWGSASSASEARPLIEAVKRASDAGVIFVTSAGNHGENTDQFSTYPANAKFANTITVGASNESDGRPDWSNYGYTKVDLAAPGKAILSTLPSNRYGKMSGTSMAAPLVAGLVAFLRAQNPALTGEMARSLLQLTGEKITMKSACNCRVDAFAATEALMREKMFVSPAARAVLVGGSLRFTAHFGEAPYSFQVDNSRVGDIDAQGRFTARAPGVTTITATDANGATATTLAIRVSHPTSDNED